MTPATQLIVSDIVSLPITQNSTDYFIDPKHYDRQFQERANKHNAVVTRNKKGMCFLEPKAV